MIVKRRAFLHIRGLKLKMTSCINACCYECGYPHENKFNFCPFCGTEVSIDEERSLVNYYPLRGYESIVKILAKQHDIQISERTLKYRLQSYSLRRMFPICDLAGVKCMPWLYGRTQIQGKIHFGVTLSKKLAVF